LPMPESQPLSAASSSAQARERSCIFSSIHFY
jgi:hypothetical protein